MSVPGNAIPGILPANMPWPANLPKPGAAPIPSQAEQAAAVKPKKTAASKPAPAKTAPKAAATPAPAPTPKPKKEKTVTEAAPAAPKNVLIAPSLRDARKALEAEIATADSVVKTAQSRLLKARDALNALNILTGNGAAPAAKTAKKAAAVDEPRPVRKPAKAGAPKAGNKLPDAITMVLGKNKALKAAEITAKVIEGGFSTDSKNLKNVVNVTMHRLEKNGRVSRDADNRWSLV